MKSTYTLLLALAATSAAASAQTIITRNITGATAFRSASHNAILALLGPGTEYAFVGSNLGSANRSIFRKTTNDNGTPLILTDDTITIVRGSWSGSTQGILDLADQTAIQYLTSANTMSTTGTNLTNPAFENAVSRFAFSDVDKALSARPNSGIFSNPVGIVPFMFVAGESAPATVTNMTDQLHNTMWAAGELPASLFTGNAADAGFTLFATGRNNGSGTRAAVLSETRYGSATSVIQFSSTFTGNAATGALTGGVSAYLPNGNGGGSSNSNVRDLLVRTSNPTFLGGNYAYVSYLTISDAVAATGYDQATGLTTLSSEGAKPMTYNGVRYSEANVYNGSYTLWSFQQFYTAVSPTGAETQFQTDLKAAIDTSLTPATGLRTSLLQVQRTGGDGGPVAP
jgi:hypothetical protein